MHYVQAIMRLPNPLRLEAWFQFCESILPVLRVHPILDF